MVWSPGGRLQTHGTNDRRTGIIDNWKLKQLKGSFECLNMDLRNQRLVASISFEHHNYLKYKAFENLKQPMLKNAQGESSFYSFTKRNS